MALQQCRDDGVTTDARPVENLRRHGAEATFNLDAGLHAPGRTPGWRHGGTEVWRLGWCETEEVCRGLPIAIHGLRHRTPASPAGAQEADRAADPLHVGRRESLQPAIIAKQRPRASAVHRDAVQARSEDSRVSRHGAYPSPQRLRTMPRPGQARRRAPSRRPTRW